MEKELLVSIKFGVCSLVINRPKSRNALTVKLISELSTAFQNASSDQSVRCIHLSASGKDAFCAGADLRELNSRTSLAGREEFFLSLAQLLDIMEGCKKPIITSVFGFALAGGLGLVASSDIVLASSDSKFGLPELHIGMVPMVVMTPLERVINKRALSYMALSCEQITAKEALRIGLVTAVYPKKSLNGKTKLLLKSLVSKGPASLKATRDVLNEKDKVDYKSRLRRRAQQIAILSLSEETKEGIDAFLNKRKPNWSKQ